MKKVLSIVLAASIGGLIAVGISKQFDKKDYQSFEEKQNVAFTNLPQTSDGTRVDFTKASEYVTPTVVHIISTIEANPSAKKEQFDPFDFFDMPQPGPQQGSGSGVIISDDGYIATNNHVIDKATTIQVILNDKRSYRATLIGTDPQTDLALLKIEEAALPFLKFGNSDQVKVGEWVLAVGNPFNLTSTVTAGIVSAKGRNINLLRTRDNQYAIENFIQTDAAVNPGNSGGALVNMKGELVGINTAIASRTGSFSGYSFAVPVNIVKKVMDDLLKYGTVQRGFLGVSIRDVDATLAEEKDIDALEGVYVAAISEEGAAKDAGIEEGDIILKINDKAVNSSSELQEEVSQYYPGDEVKVTLRRGSKTLDKKAILRNMEGKAELLKKEPRKSTFETAGITLKNLDRETRKKLKLRAGVQVSNISSGPFKDAGIKKDFIITKIDKRDVFSAKEAHAILAKKEGAILIEGITLDGDERVYGLSIKRK